MFRVLLALPLLALAACERPADPAPVEAQAPAAVVPKRTLPPPTFAGRWAAEPDLCDDGAWVVSADGVRTAGEVSCKFDAPLTGHGPITVDATCWAEGAPQRHRLTLSYAESAKSLLIEGGPFAPVGLVRCAAPPS